MMDAMRPAPEAVRPRGQEAGSEAGEAALVGQNEAGPLVGHEAATVGQAEAGDPVAPSGAAPVGQPLGGPAPIYKASAGASKIAAKGQRARDEAAAEAIRLQAETEARLRAEAAKEAARARKEAAREAAKQRRREAMGRAVGRVLEAARRGVTYAREHADSVYSMGIYGAAVGVAGTSQAQVAHDLFHWSWPRAIGGAAFIEGLALAFALTAHKQRMQGEKAFLLRALTAAAAGFGAWVNYTAHANDPSLPDWVAQVMGVVLGASSIAGIVLWEMRTNARTRKELRKAEKKAAPKAQLGLDLLLRYPGTWFWAWSAMIANPRVRTREDALRVGREMRAARRERLERKAARREALKVDAEIREAAKKAAIKAAKKGEAGLALTHLAHLARYGSAALVGQPALEAGPSQAKAGLTIEGAIVAAEAGPRPTAGEAGPGLAAPRPTAPEAGPRPPAPEVGPASGEAAGPEPHSAAPAGPVAHEVERPAPDAGGQGAKVPDLGAARTEHEARIDELAAMFPDSIPTRRTVITRAQQLAGQGVELKFAWTSNRTVDNAIKALRERRSTAA